MAGVAEGLPAGIDLLPSGKYRVRVKGMPTKAFTNRRDAERHQAELRRMKETGMRPVGKITLAELAAEHMSAVHRDLSDNAYTVYRNIWAAHVDGRVRPPRDGSAATVDPLANRKIAEIDPRAVEQWRDDRLAVGAGRQSIRKTMALMQTIFDRGVRDHGLVRNPVSLVKKPSGQREEDPRPISPVAVERIRAELGGVDSMMVAVLAYSGLRPGEARALRWEDIGRERIHVRFAIAGTTQKRTKTNRSRPVRLVEPLARDLAAWRTASGNPNDDALVFPRADGQPWRDTDWDNWRDRKFAPAVKAAGVAIGRPYHLRHSAASLWLHEGYPIMQVAAWLGHDAATCWKDYAAIIEDIDPLDRTPAAEQIAAARQAVAVTPS